MSRYQRFFAYVGLGALAISLLGLWKSHDQFFESYLIAFLFWFGIAIGSIGLISLHWVVGGAWGKLILPLLESAAQTIPWLGFLFIPIFFGLSAIYPWARPALVATIPVLQHRHVYMNPMFFDARVIVHFIIWSLVAAWVARRTLPGSKHESLTLLDCQRRGAFALIIFMLTINVSAVDWMMSIEVSWYSTIYGVMIMIAWILSTLAFMTWVLALMKDPVKLSDEIPKKPFWDVGNLTLAFVMLWAYMSFSQYIIVWSANKPDEISWYLDRQRGGWFWVAMALVVFQFFFPFFYLLMRGNKQRLEKLVKVAVWVFGMGAVNLYWIVKPSFSPGVFTIHWLDFTTWIGVGGVWLALFIGQLQKRPVIAWLDQLKRQASEVHA